MIGTNTDNSQPQQEHSTENDGTDHKSRPVLPVQAVLSDALNQKKIRDICWEVGGHFPKSLKLESMTLLSMHPRQAHIQWNILQPTVEKLKTSVGGAFDNARLVLRVYDVTDIIFDGFNAHRWFDIDIKDLSGNYYLTIQQFERNLMAETGFRLVDNRFLPMVRSNTMYFERDRPSMSSATRGYFVGGKIKRKFPVESMYDAPLYEPLGFAMAARKFRPLRIAVVKLVPDGVFQSGKGNDGVLGAVMRRCAEMGESVALFEAGENELTAVRQFPFLRQIKYLSIVLFKRLAHHHVKRPFHIVDCHDWFSYLVCAAAVQRLGVPMALTLHSIEKERAGEGFGTGISQTIAHWEILAVQRAGRVLVASQWAAEEIKARYAAREGLITVLSYRGLDPQNQLAIEQTAARCLTNYYEVVQEHKGDRQHG